MLQTTSLFTHLEPEAAEETFTTLFEKAGVKIERIASHGQRDADERLRTLVLEAVSGRAGHDATDEDSSAPRGDR